MKSRRRFATGTQDDDQHSQPRSKHMPRGCASGLHWLPSSRPSTLPACAIFLLSGVPHLPLSSHGMSRLRNHSRHRSAAPRPFHRSLAPQRTHHDSSTANDNHLCCNLLSSSSPVSNLPLAAATRCRNLLSPGHCSHLHACPQSGLSLAQTQNGPGTSRGHLAKKMK